MYNSAFFFFTFNVSVYLIMEEIETRKEKEVKSGSTLGVKFLNYWRNAYLIVCAEKPNYPSHCSTSLKYKNVTFFSDFSWCSIEVPITTPVLY